jgi:hypothetical protein
MRRWGGNHGHGAGGRREHQAKLAERLAPLEESEEFSQSGQHDGKRGVDDTIRVDSSSVRMPEHLLEDERGASSTFRLEPVVLFILLAMLAFIAFIAWQITLMPSK